MEGTWVWEQKVHSPVNAPSTNTIYTTPHPTASHPQKSCGMGGLNSNVVQWNSSSTIQWHSILGFGRGVASCRTLPISVPPVEQQMIHLCSAPSWACIRGRGCACAYRARGWIGGGMVELCHPPGESQSRPLRIPPQGASESRTSTSRSIMRVSSGWERVVGWLGGGYCLSLASHSNPISASSIATGDRPPFSSLWSLPRVSCVSRKTLKLTA